MLNRAKRWASKGMTRAQRNQAVKDLIREPALIVQFANSHMLHGWRAWCERRLGGSSGDSGSASVLEYATVIGGHTPEKEKKDGGGERDSLRISIRLGDQAGLKLLLETLRYIAKCCHGTSGAQKAAAGAAGGAPGSGGQVKRSPLYMPPSLLPFFPMVVDADAKVQQQKDEEAAEAAEEERQQAGGGGQEGDDRDRSSRSISSFSSFSSFVNGTSSGGGSGGSSSASSDELEHTLHRLLLAASRTTSGGDSYTECERLFKNEGHLDVVITALSEPTPPLELIVMAQTEGQTSMVMAQSVNAYRAIHFSDEGDTEEWAYFSTTVAEIIDIADAKSDVRMLNIVFSLPAATALSRVLA
jgi:hypothetical protein